MSESLHISPFVDEDDDPKARMPYDALQKQKCWSAPKGIARASLTVALDLLERGKKPSRVANKISMRFLEILLDPKTDSQTFLSCYKEFHDRCDGKAPQAVALTDPDGGKLEITWRSS